MNTTSFSRSFLAEDIQAYLDFKRATGRKFHTEAAALRLLDRFLFGLSIDRTALSPTLIEAFLASRPRTRPRSFNHLLGVLRCFFAWLVAQGRLPHSPVQARPRPNSSRRLPFLFEPQQVQRLIELATQLLDNPRAMHRAEVYPLIFKLMYGLGLRVGEVVRLRCGDVALDRRLLVIHETKFGKSRLVPYGPKLGAYIEAYLTRRTDWYGTWQPEDPLFSFSHNHSTPLSTEAVSHTFRCLIPKLGLSPTPGIASPCLHGLRHSFAVQTLLRWYRSGINPGSRLFHLSTFMGHSDPASTSWYLTITDALLTEANLRFEHLVNSVSREVNL